MRKLSKIPDWGLVVVYAMMACSSTLNLIQSNNIVAKVAWTMCALLWGICVIAKININMKDADTDDDHQEDDNVKENNIFQPLPKNTIVNGYDCHGLSEYLFTCIKDEFPIGYLLTEYEESKDDIIECIETSLRNIGF